MAELKKAPWPDWETVRLIGRGGFGTVYEIQRKLVDDETESAALKVITIPQNPSDVEELYSEGYDDESITATFNSHLKSIIAEYSLMQKMDGSTNVVNCKDIRYIQHDDDIGWDIFIRMELLTPLIKALPTIVTEDLVISIGRDICNALVLCKKHGIIHRDIKPQNIFVSPNGDYKLGDFGIAKTVERTMGGTKIGTYKYMAPEVYHNKPYGSAADIYSLGLVLYWLLNERRMPFMPLPPAMLTAGMDEVARTRRLSGEQFAEPKNGSEQLKAIVMKACAYNIADRYASASDMLKDLNQIGQDYSGRTAESTAGQDINEAQCNPVLEDEVDKTIGVFGGALPDNAAIPEIQQEEGTVGPFLKLAEKPSYEKPTASESAMPKDETEVIPGAEEDEEGTVGPFFKPTAKPSFERPMAFESVKPNENTEIIPAVEEKTAVAVKIDRSTISSPQKNASAEPAPAPKKKTLPIILGAVAVVLLVAVITVVLFGLGSNNANHSEKPETNNVIVLSTPDITSRINKAAGITLGWNKIEGATGYAIYRKPYSGNDSWERVATISGNTTFTWTDTSVKNENGTAYKYTIRALAGADMKTMSGCRIEGRSMVRLTSRTLSGATKASATSIKCTWTTSSAVTGYEVRFMVGDTVYKTFTVSDCKVGVKTFTGLEAGQTYKIQVRSYKKIDGMEFFSAWSTAKNVTL